MKRIVKNQVEQELLNAMFKFHSLLREGFMSRSKINMKIAVPQFKYSELNHHTELKLALECLKNNYREYLKYLKIDGYLPLLKVIYLYENCEDCIPVMLNITLDDFLESDFYLGKEDLGS